MSNRPLRIQRLLEIFLCANRTFQNAHLIPTDPISTSRIVGQMSRIAARYDLEIFTYSFMPNGFWMLLCDPDGQKAKFFRDFQSWMAGWVNHGTDRTGSLFHERYDDEAILDQQMLLDTFVDVTVAPIREGFAEDLDEYTGATSWKSLTTGEASVGHWVDRDRLRSLRRSNPDLNEADIARDQDLQLASLPIAGPGDEGEEDEEIDEAATAALLIEKVHARVQRILTYQDNVDWNTILELREKPREAPWSIPPEEPMGPPKYRYGSTCKTYSPALFDSYQTMRRKKRKEYTETMIRWKKSGLVWWVDDEEDEGPAQFDRSLNPLPNIQNADPEDLNEGKLLRFPKCSFPPGWPNMRKPLDRKPSTAPDLLPSAA